MIVRGRVTLFGEYLMHAHTEGYVFPTQRCLASADQLDVPKHADYVAEHDSVLRWLHERGISGTRPLRGDLPLGCGFASSTALVRIHLQDVTDHQFRIIANMVDSHVHGFQPSGLDRESVVQQNNGLFGMGRWRSAPNMIDFCSAIILDRTRFISLVEARKRVTAISDDLVPLARRLVDGIFRSNRLEYEVLNDYCRLLLQANVYDPIRHEMVQSILSAGVAAKGVGGLVDKAIILVWPDEWSLHERHAFWSKVAGLGTGKAIFQL